MAQFAIENLTFSYPTDPEHPSLQEVSLQVEPGGIHRPVRQVRQRKNHSPAAPEDCPHPPRQSHGVYLL